MDTVVNNFSEALLSMDQVAAHKLMRRQVQIKTPLQFVEDVVVEALEHIGELWQRGDVALSQVYMGGRICERLVDEILPPKAPERTDQPTMAICVLADHHKLGKSIVYSILRASGYELSDFDTQEVDQLVDRLEEEKVKILLISVLMLSSALKVKNVVDQLGQRGMQVKIIVGGAPFRLDNDLWKEIGADAMCINASEAVAVIEQIMGEVE